MDRRTQTLIAGTIVLLGIGVVALGFIEEESGVRYVEQLHEDPSSSEVTTVTLIGELQPRLIPNSTGDSTPNPDWQESIAWVTHDTRDGFPYRHVNELSAVQDGDNVIEWTLRSWSQRTDRSAPEGEPVVQQWTTQGHLFQVKSFETDQSIWAFMQSNPGELFVKPSQMEGHVLGATDVPEGALIFHVEELAQQCSSKFIPESVRDDFVDTDGDGYVDDRA